MGIHRNTPTLAVNDPRGLAILNVNYWRADAALASEPRIERTLRDVAGRVVKQWDARLWALQVIDPQAPASLTTTHALNDIALRSDSSDAGVQVRLPGLAGQTLFNWDSRGTCREIAYDDLLRPVAVFEEGTGVPRRCAERFAYGRPGFGEALRNQLGQLIRHDDPAGSVLFEQFAITGQCCEKTPDTSCSSRLCRIGQMLTLSARYRWSPKGQPRNGAFHRRAPCWNRWMPLVIGRYSR
ncbi:hypothetical protein [Pseudomonas moraviensis]|uniref:hypothetical protein n=1 Tax=Pseudomonas moraviensis TaxID=321662 RepID=UPI0026D7A05D|nr:hypothetical protein [Pseudomonas moraviensis]